MDLIYPLSLNVRYGETGHDGVATLTSLANWLQEAAGQSANRLGFGEEALTAYGVTWILTRLVLRIRRLPKAGEKITVRSWPSYLDRFGHRGYQVVDQEGEIIVSGGSAWAVMDINTRRMSAIPEELIKNYPASPPPCDAFTSRILSPIDSCTPEAKQARVLVRKDDLDINRHVNNAHYLSWLLEPLAYNPGAVSIPGLLDISFRAECFPGDALISCCQPQASKDVPNPAPGILPDKPLTLIHDIRRVNEEGQPDNEVCRAVTLWSSLEGIL